MWALVLSAALFVGCEMPEKQDDKPLSKSEKVLIAAIPLANLADYVTTEKALADGGYELNPAMRSKGARVTLKALATAGGMAGARKLFKDGHATAGTIAALASIGIPLAASAWNMRQMQKR